VKLAPSRPRISFYKDSRDTREKRTKVGRGDALHASRETGGMGMTRRRELQQECRSDGSATRTSEGGGGGGPPAYMG